MKRILFSPLFAIPLLLISAATAHQHLTQSFSPRYPSFREFIVLSDEMVLQDVGLVSLGFRSVASDLAWIQLLQYYGGASILNVRDETPNFPSLKPLTLRVMRIDPYFVRAAVFGSAALAWLKISKRPDEAVDILDEGIRYNPTSWILQSYLVSIAYQAKDQFEEMLRALGSTLRHPECPVQVKAILANTYKLHHRYQESYAIWDDIYSSTDDLAYKNRALTQMEELRYFLGS